MFDYMDWRGDLPFQKIEFNEIDALILSSFIYVDFSRFICSSFSSSTSLSLAVGMLLRERDYSSMLFHQKEDEILLHKIIKCERYAQIRFCGYKDVVKEDIYEQFCAVTVLLPDGSAAVVFRGTDSTIVGWKEDFDLSFMDEVPAQREAINYVETLARNFDGPIMLLGHSKGGNLAMYAASFCDREIQDRITKVINFDGPGLNERAIYSAGYLRIRRKLRTYLPKSSVIGMLLEQSDNFTIVDSDSIGIFQHNIYNWEIFGKGFVTVEELTNSSQFIDSTFKQSLLQMSPSLRSKIVNGVYSVFCSAGVSTVSDFTNLRKIKAIFKAAKKLEPETRDALLSTYHIMKKAAKSSLHVFRK